MASSAPLERRNVPRDIEITLQKLTIDEKISLLSGIDFWHTAPVHRLGIKSIRFSDGPNGVRGTRFFNGVPAACLPCGTGLAATWDVDLIDDAGKLQGDEAIAKGVSVILGPTVNMQRSPLGGRGFESFSEDPYLSGSMAAATIKGIQSRGVSATIKHFVCNDQEHERQAVNATVTQRALREIYLMPFQIAQRDAQPGCVMSAYNRVDGMHVSEHSGLLRNILRGQLEFDGMIMSDWFGTYTTSNSIKAGLNLEMPGPTALRGELVRQALGCRKLLEIEIDDCVRCILQMIKKAELLGLPENAPEGTLDNEKTSQLLRELSNEGIVLMKNEENILPFSKTKSIAVIGPNANYASYCGGGSASLLPYYAISPLEGIKAKASDVRYALGAIGWKRLPLLSRLSKDEDGRLGLSMRVYLDPPSCRDREVIDEIRVGNSDILLVDYKHPRISGNLYYCELAALFTPSEPGPYEFSLTVAGTGKLFIDDTVVVDNETNQVPGDSFFGFGTREQIGSMDMQADRTYKIVVQFGTAPTRNYNVTGATAMGAGGIRIGCEKKRHPEKLISEATKLAAAVDQVIICAGLNSDWESEGYDREDMNLPPGSDQLIQAVTAVNKNTAVVIQSGTPVSMPWLASTKALLQAWYGGNECGNAIADVIFGDVNPSGKLPLTFPKRVEDNPAFLNSRSERGQIFYGEGIYIGYRYYEKTRKDVLFPFGHGLSYTTFALRDLEVEDEANKNSVKRRAVNRNIRVSVSVRNTGSRAGAEVVQCYVSQRNPSVSRPVKELKGFAKVFLQPGHERRITILLSKRYAVSFFDEERDTWVMEKDEYDVLVGTSSADGEDARGGGSKMLRGTFSVVQWSWWRGL